MMHRGYEYQWFGMAAVLGLFFGYSVIRRKAESGRCRIQAPV
jgi:cytochrome oxidase assembly protein ShyY1